MDIARIAAYRIFGFYRWIFRPITLGVKAAVFDEEGRVLLVRHTYQPGWHLPGGGVKGGESVREAATRELREETGVEALELPAQPFGVYANLESKFDHVVLFVFEKWRVLPDAPPSGEIAEHGFFARDKLPIGTSRATQRRLAELRDGVARSESW